MNNKPSAQTLMVLPISRTTLTFDSKSEKFEVLEDLFYTMIKIQPDMTETVKIDFFHSLMLKNALQTSVISPRQIDKLGKHIGCIPKKIRQTLVPSLKNFMRELEKPLPRLPMQ